MSSPPDRRHRHRDAPATLRGYAREAGFASMEVLPTGEFGFWRFYRLR